jgi:FKBP-type peptidyl-prolyl cis-trans isomerase FklB
MKRALLISTCLLLLLSQTAVAQTPTLKTPKEKLSYVIGVQIGSDFKGQKMDVDPDLVAKGMKDAIAGNKLLLSDQEAKEVITTFQKEKAAADAEAKKGLAEKNKKEGTAFLAANAKKEGVKTLPSGLQYKVIKEGTGKTPKATDTVDTHYQGTLIDGREFDSSYKRGQPASFAVNGVIKGWTEALQLMKAGSKWQLFVPPELAYGDRGAGPLIGPNATLIFEVELISVK